MRNWGVENREIASVLRIVIAQRLVRRLCPHCRREEQPSDQDRRWAQSCHVELPERVPRAQGCPRCLGLGYHGRVGLFDVWELDEVELDRIARGVHARQLREARRKAGVPSMAQAAVDKVTQGITTIDELRGAALRG